MKTIQFIFGAMLIMLFITSCKPEYVAPDIVFGDPYAGIDGTWKLKSFAQADSLYKAIPKDKPVLDLKNFWTKGGNEYTCTFNKTNRTYTTVGDVRFNYLGAAGKFVFDDDKNPSTITMTPTGGQPMTVRLLKPIRAEYNNNLEIAQIKQVKGKNSFSYNYTFTK